jgi:hypothetical protein
MIPQNQENGLFAKKTYAPEGYKESIKYIASQPLEQRKNGFGTKDASRRDEFSNNIRTEQYRETLRKEKLLAENPEELQEKLDKMMAERASIDAQTRELESRRTFSNTKNVHQYDIGRSQVTQFDPRATKDTFYKFDPNQDKFLGTMTAPVSNDIGRGAWDVHYKPPSFGGKSEVKNFYDKSHLSISPY